MLGAGAVGAKEAVEDPRQVLRGDARRRCRRPRARRGRPPPRTRSVTAPPSGVYLIALSRRFTTTCFRRGRSPSTRTGASASQETEIRRSSARSVIWLAVVATSSARSKRAHSDWASPASRRERAKSRSTIIDSRSTSSRSPPRRSRWAAGPPSSLTIASSSPRRIVSGVRSSWEASATKRFELRKASSRRWIIRLSASDRLSSSSPVPGTGRRSPRLCWVICSALTVISSTGRRVRRISR